MDSKRINPFLYATKFGCTLGIVYIVYQTIRTLLGEHYINTSFNLLFLLLSFIGIIGFTIYSFKKENEHNLSMKQAILSGITVSVITSLSVILFTIVLTTMIEPDYYSTYTEQNRERHILGNPDRTPEQIESDIRAGLASLSGDIQQALILYNIGGLLLSLPIGFALRTKAS